MMPYAEDCQVRLKNNVLRILDCKKQTCIQVVKEAEIKPTLCVTCEKHFQDVQSGLDILGITYVLAPTMVRGLDYYTKTIFEITHPKLGAQDAIGAGGRYDTLLSELQGPDLGAVGFALGMERLVIAANIQLPAVLNNLVYIVNLNEEASKFGLKLLEELRQAGISSDMDYEDKSLKGALRKANDIGARYVILVGEDEIKKSAVTLKDMTKGDQKEIAFNDILPYLKNSLTDKG